MKRDQFTFYRSYYEALKQLSKKERDDVLMCICAYALDGAPPTLTGVPLSIFTLIRPTLDSGRNKAQNRANKLKSNEGQNENKCESNENQSSKEGEREEEEEEGEGENECYKRIKRKIFVPPSVDEVRVYCLERRNGIDPEAFVDFYASKGWLVGKTPMKDWKAAVRTWERSRTGTGRKEDPYADVV